MAESGIIREFLVALGFKLDEKGMKDFTDSVDRTTKAVGRLATRVTGTALAVSVAATKIASNLEQLYFASIKANDSATNLRAFDRAAQNLGTDAGEALESVQGLARAIRTNPGVEGWIRSLGVETRNAKGELLGTTDLMLGLAKAFAGMQYYLANQIAGQLGISEDTLRAMRSGGFEREVLRMREQMKNTGLDKAAADAHRFMNEIRDLVVQLEVFGVQVFDAISNRLGGGVKSLVEWLRINGPALAQRTADMVLKLIALADRALPVLGRFVDYLVELDKKTDGWSTRILALLALLKLFGGFGVLGGILGLVSGFTKLTASIMGASEATTALLGLLSRLTLLGGIAYGAYKLYQNTSPKPGDKEGRTPWSVKFEDWLREHGLMSSRRDQILFEMHKAGYTREQALGAIANLERESGLNENAVGDNGAAYGIAQWHADRQALFKKWTGIDIRNSTFAQQMSFMLHELATNEKPADAMLRAAQNAELAAQVFSKYYERPSKETYEANLRGAAAVQLSQDTKIIIQGSRDPAATGRAAANEQQRVNADLARNFAAVVQ